MSTGDVMEQDLSKMQCEPEEIQPTHDRILVELFEPEGVSDGGIIIPDTAKTQPLVGQIIKTGPGAWDKEKNKRVPTYPETGDYVLISNITYTKEEILVHPDTDKKYVIIQEHKVNGIFASRKDAMFGRYEHADQNVDELVDTA